MPKKADWTKGPSLSATYCMYYVERGYYFLFLRVLLILLSHQQLHKTVLTSHLKREEMKTKTLFLLSNRSYTDLYKDFPGLASIMAINSINHNWTLMIKMKVETIINTRPEQYLRLMSGWACPVSHNAVLLPSLDLRIFSGDWSSLFSLSP